MKKYCIILLLIILYVPVYSQLSGIINQYIDVTSISNAVTTDNDTVTVSDATNFNAGDTVMIIQMQGAQANYPNDEDWGNLKNSLIGRKYIGRYEYHIISEKITDQLVLRSNLTQISVEGSYYTAGKVQLIKVASYKNASIDAEVTCPAWDGTTGGIVAIMVDDTLTFNANINVSGKGFRGGTVSTYNGSCAIEDSTNYRKFFYPESATDSAGRKGEGIVLYDTVYARGAGKLINAGGGGNGKNSGGGGGGHYRDGGHGGDEEDLCDELKGIDDFNRIGGRGGQGVGNYPQYFYSDSVSIGLRIIMGGGGGAGTKLGTASSSDGGDGGGIVIITARNIKGNSFSILAQGEDVAGTSTGGAGGGGAGGAILLDVETYTNNLTADASGGNGGSTSGSDCPGPGGGGAGGVVWHFSSSLPPLVQTELDGGAHGVAYCLDTKVTDGYDGEVVSDIFVPLRGFLFNIMPVNQEICQFTQPELINASTPRGGDGNYNIKWFKTEDFATWDSVANTEDYQPPVLTDTSYYKRIILSGKVKDTSSIHTINVLPAIQNNAIASHQTICQGQLPADLTGTVPTQGNGVDYAFLWVSGQDSSSLSSAAGTNSLQNYTMPAALFDTTYYFRIVYSGACVDTSTAVKLFVLPSIGNNTLLADQTICQYSIPDTITGASHTGGDQVDYNYIWQYSANMSAWDSIANVKDYSSPALSDTSYFRRIILSGLNKVCKDTSAVHTIYTVPIIQNNTISDNQNICEASFPDTIAGSWPTGGDGSFSYQWEESYDTLSWDSLTLAIDTPFYMPDTLHTSRYFRRIVRSGLNDCCKDTAETPVYVLVTPMIENNLIYNNQTICLGVEADTIGRNPEALSGGTSFYSYQWIEKTTGDWSITSNADTSYLYSPGSITDTTYYCRIVYSGVCTDSSNMLTIQVLDIISNNLIINGSLIYTCYETAPELLQGTHPAGADQDSITYLWQISDNETTWQTAAGSSSQQNYQAEALASEKYIRRIVQSRTCQDTSAHTNIRIHPLPTAIISNNLDTICSGTEKRIMISFTGQTPFTIKYSDGANSNISAPTLTEMDTYFTITPDADVSYTYIYTLDSVVDGNGCVAVNMTGSDTLTVYETPNPNSGENNEICSNSYSLIATPSVGTGLWSGPEGMTFSLPSNSSSTATSQSYGQKKIIWTETNWECKQSDTVIITFYKQPDWPFAGNDTIVYYTETMQLNARKPNAGGGSWSLISGSGSFENDSLHNTIVSYLDYGTNIYEWTVFNGVCEIRKDTVSVKRQYIKLPNAFSPDGNDINDFFVMPGLEYSDESEIIIFNRWGHEVFSTKNYHENWWDGKDNYNKDVPEDTYFYILKVTKNNITSTHKGFLILKRNQP